MVFEKKNVRLSDLSSLVSAWDGCGASCPHDDMPKGWTRLLMFWSKKPELDFWKVPQRDWLRDAVLCPEHTAALERQLIARDLDREPQGNLRRSSRPFRRKQAAWWQSAR
jgi:hypothetical protein